MSAAIDAVVAILKAVNAVLSIIPGLVWAIVLAVALTAFGWERHEVGVAQHAKVTAEKARDAAIGEKNQVLAQLEQQKKDAKAKLDELTAARDAAQSAANDARRAMEIKDANTAKVIGYQAARLHALAAAAPGGQLRDPNAECGGGGCGTKAEGAPGAAGDAGRPPSGGGLLSAPLSRLLFGDAAIADDLNRGYAACLGDDAIVRRLLETTP